MNPLLISTILGKAMDGFTVTRQVQDVASYAGPTVLAEPFFMNFRSATNQQLGGPFLLLKALPATVKNMVVFLSYSQENAAVFKGYVKDLLGAMKSRFGEAEAYLVNYPSAGCPMDGSVLALVGGPMRPLEPMPLRMPSVYIPGLISHALRFCNPRAGQYGSSLGLVRSDLHMLPAPMFWKGKPLLLEYRSGDTVSIERMRVEDSGRLFGTEPMHFNNTLCQTVPADVIRYVAGHLTGG